MDVYIKIMMKEDEMIEKRNKKVASPTGGSKNPVRRST
jgi:hypothetical protein